jgi:hypothetical protein
MGRDDQQNQRGGILAWLGGPPLSPSGDYSMDRQAGCRRVRCTLALLVTMDGRGRNVDGQASILMRLLSLPHARQRRTTEEKR